MALIKDDKVVQVAYVDEKTDQEWYDSVRQQFEYVIEVPEFTVGVGDSYINGEFIKAQPEET